MERVWAPVWDSLLQTCQGLNDVQDLLGCCRCSSERVLVSLSSPLLPLLDDPCKIVLGLCAVLFPVYITMCFCVTPVLHGQAVCIQTGQSPWISIWGCSCPHC